MHKQMRLQALIVQATCSVQLIILKTTLNVYLQWLKRLILQKKLLIKKRYYCRRNKMYQEQPGYKLMFNTLRAMYQQHPIRVDIAGSVESIYDITKDDLYLCYETFYHPSNMVLFVVGDVNPEEICRIVKQHEDARNKVNQPKIERGLVDEPEDVKEAFVTESMKIQSPRLMLGFKNKPLQEAPQKYVQRDLEMSLFFELIFGKKQIFIRIY